MKNVFSKCNNEKGGGGGFVIRCAHFAGGTISTLRNVLDGTGFKFTAAHLTVDK